MSVIMGYKTEDKLYLAADNRVYTVENGAIRDDENKIVVINNNVAVACSGYNGTQTVFENMIKNINSSKDYRVEDALLHLKLIYWVCKLPWRKKFSKNILNIGSRFIVAGKNRKNEYCMYTISYLNGKLEKPSLTDRFMFPPSDVSAKECWDIYAKNVVSLHSDFMQRTVRDISKVSKFVSHSGDMWIYDFVTDNSKLEHFD